MNFYEYTDWLAFGPRPFTDPRHTVITRSKSYLAQSHLTRSMGRIDHGVSVFIFQDGVFEYTLTGVWVPIRYRSTAHNISWIVFIFGTFINLSQSCWLWGLYVILIWYLTCFLHKAGWGSRPIDTPGRRTCSLRTWNSRGVDSVNAPVTSHSQAPYGLFPGSLRAVLNKNRTSSLGRRKHRPQSR